MTRPKEPELPLTRAELQALQKRLAEMSQSAAESFYHSAYRRCQFVRRPPSARSIQELVAVWKHLAKRRLGTPPQIMGDPSVNNSA